MGILYTFYSYKGGVGRSMALANVATLLSSWGHSVLAIDWDLEAPGLEKYFMKEPSLVEDSRTEKPGVVDLVTAFESELSLKWEDCLLKVYPFGKAGNRLDIISAGQDTPEYVPNLQSIDWRQLFDRGFGAYLEGLRDEWLLKYDFVLVDSRTGITDIGGVCTIHLPDILVVFFTANEQSLNGVLDVVERANAKFEKLPDEYERPDKLLCVPVPSRFEYYTEYESATRWLKKFAERLESVYKEWLPEKVTPADVLEKLYVPNIPFWSFGEGLPVVHEGTTNPRSLGFAYELLAKLLKHHLQWKDTLRGDEPISEESTPEFINLQAERSFTLLNKEEQELAQGILLNLVLLSPTAKGHESRRLAPLSEFSNEPWQGVVKKLTTSGLLVSLHDGPSDEASVQIAHDAILRSWKRLRKWLDQDRDFLVWRQQTRARVGEWEGDERRSSYLLTGPALETAAQFAKERSTDLGQMELSYVERSLDEAAHVRRAARHKIGIFFLVILVFIGGFFAYRSYKNRQNIKAQEAAFNRAVRLTAQGTTFFEDGDISQAIAAYDEALAQKPDYAAAYLRRGEAVLNLANSKTNETERTKLTADAINDFQKAADLTTDPEIKRLAIGFRDDAISAVKPLADLIPTPSPVLSPSLSPTASPTSSPIASPIFSPGATPTPLDIAPRVYIQAADDTKSRELARACMNSLRKAKYLAPGVETVTNVPKTTEVRYFRKVDQNDVAKIISILAATGVRDAQPKYVAGYEKSQSMRPRHFEVWLSGGAGGPSLD